ncbi:MAG: hypothetical protein ABIO70_13440 [Pseudomonadota bacterium]
MCARTFLAALLLLTVCGPRAHAACPQPTLARDLLAQLDVAEQSVGRDAARFSGAAGAIEAGLPCLERVLNPEIAARIHRIEGLSSFVAGDRQRALEAFAAAQRLAPEFRFPEAVFPAAHPVPQLWGQAAEVARVVEPVALPDTVVLWVDGTIVTARPTTTPAVVQLQARDGSVLATAYTWPADPLPIPLALAEARSIRSDIGNTITVPRAHHPHIPLAVGAGLSALAAAGSYALAWGTARDYRDNPHTDAELEQLRAQANTLVFVSVGLGTVAVGAGLGAGFAWPR